MIRRPDGGDDSAEAWQTTMAEEATTAAGVLVSITAATPAATQSVAVNRPDGNDNSVAIAMQ